MNAKQTLPALATLSPVIAAAPPVVVLLGLGALALWLFRSDKPAEAAPSPAPEPIPARQPEPLAPARRVTREDVAEALAYGAQPVPRKTAVEALQALGFGKTAAYKALAPSSRFADLFLETEDGMIEWQG